MRDHDAMPWDAGPLPSVPAVDVPKIGLRWYRTLRASPTNFRAAAVTRAAPSRKVGWRRAGGGPARVPRPFRNCSTSLLPCELLEERELEDRLVGSRLRLHEIHARGHRAAVVVRAVPANLVRSGRGELVLQGLHKTPVDRVDPD